MKPSEIAFALEERLATLADLPPTAWLNEDESSMPTRAIYLSLALMRNDPSLYTTTGTHLDMGIFQVTVVAPKGSGDRSPDEVADAVAAHFPFNLRLGDLQIFPKPTVHGGAPDDTGWRVPVSIHYRVL